eukprot:CAMPEP_0179027952 /NCGR_PEP_ID=MMETSP0796-20121207/9300_1 /TAXON_ID=73915 /ORGANISM="Pyrodinium bahamense, Strain pbaha01" /LENGTH=164 /DNA_ID=CAMNT_0020724089 /DNA_START=58 /DNA_END=554 /DNA_ORIENTATION=-
MKQGDTFDAGDATNGGSAGTATRWEQRDNKHPLGNEAAFWSAVPVDQESTCPTPPVRERAALVHEVADDLDVQLADIAVSGTEALVVQVHSEREVAHREAGLRSAHDAALKQIQGGHMLLEASEQLSAGLEAPAGEGKSHLHLQAPGGALRSVHGKGVDDVGVR